MRKTIKSEEKGICSSMARIEIRELQKKDEKKAIQFAIKGMHFDWYLSSRFLLNAYGRYFWYLELNRATQILAAYAKDQFVGILLAEMKEEEKKHKVWSERLYVKLIDGIQRLFFQDGAGLYERTIKTQLRQYLRDNQPDGEILFFAADPDSRITGIGSTLLEALEEREPGKTVYLHTDDACTYQFYEHRGFRRAEEQEIILEMPKGKIPLKCFLYDKLFPDRR